MLEKIKEVIEIMKKTMCAASIFTADILMFVSRVLRYLRISIIFKLNPARTLTESFTLKLSSMA
nr:MAG TPA: hypothetical protein [Caudoviricetes sp.]